MRLNPDASSRGQSAAGLALVLIVACLIYLPRLGADGLVDTEGHRAIPAWTMLESGDHLVPRLFGQVYLRKPPGIQWSIAASSAIFGETEFAARFPSAFASIITVAITFLFAARWFGARWALAAGLAHALMPWLWQAGRSAEIEALNNLGTQLALFAIIDVLAFQRLRSQGLTGRVVMFHVAILGVAIAALAKGPASLPCFAGVIVGCAIALRSSPSKPRFWKPLASPWAWTPLILGAIPLAIWALLVRARLDQTGETAILQSAEAFMWEPGRIVGIILLVPTAFIAALPASFAVLFPFGPDALREAEGDDARTTRLVLARALAWSFVLSLIAFALLGIGNVRYTMPAACLAPPIVAYVLRGVRAPLQDRFMPQRIAIARIMLLGRAEVLLAVLIIVAGVWVFVVEPKRGDRSGRDAGTRTGESITSHMLAEERVSTRVLADHLVEARPEVLWYAAQRAEERGVRVIPVWTPGLAGVLDSLSSEALYALRLDSGEWSEELELTPIHTDGVHVFEFGIWAGNR